MKKILVVLLILATAGGLFAQDEGGIKIGAWGRAGWAPLVIQGNQDVEGAAGDTKNYIGVGSGPAWTGDHSAAVGFTVSGSDESGVIGFQVGIRTNGDDASLYIVDQTANAWIKPFGDILKLTGGLYQVDDLRGKIGGTNENFDIGFAKTGGEDGIFTRFESSKFGFHLKLVPIDPLQIHVSLGENMAYGGDVPQDKNGIGDILTTGQYAIGFTIEDIGLARAQFIGGKYGKAGFYGANPINIGAGKAAWYNQFQLAFNLTAVEGLNLDIGATIPLKVTAKEIEDTAVYYPYGTTGLGKDGYVQEPIVIAAGAKYETGDIGVYFYADAKVGGKKNYLGVGDDTEDGIGIDVTVEPSYSLGDIGKVIADISFRFVGNGKTAGTDAKDGHMDLGLGASYHKSVGGGNFSIGLATTIPLGGDGYDGDANKVAKAQAFKLAVPIIWTYSL
ncbi:hypothetical protein AGMMS49928_29550 [Spirochaetia bacterium]|nr:hypothetical protein AGMMS49928_29550 [Spirochaetia bacterium]